MSHKTFQIDQIKVGIGEQPLVIPEIGINHNGSLKTAKEMALAAHRAGARLIKHQTHVVADEMSAAAKKVIPGNADISIYDIMSQCALGESEERDFKDYVESLGMAFISTPFSRAAAERLEQFGVHAYKIGSGELNNYPLIDHVASFGKPMIVSTGMNDMHAIEKATDILISHKVPFALLHTTNIYPTAPSLIRLGAMEELMKAYPDVPIGLSDHSLNNNACIAAMTLGACIVERHFTDTMNRVGPDITCSMDENELGRLLEAAKEIPQMLGGTKKAAPEEQPTIDFAFATVVAIHDIEPGEPFTRDNLWVKRPGTGGILAEHYEDILGKCAACPIANDTQLTSDMIQDK